MPEDDSVFEEPNQKAWVVLNNLRLGDFKDDCVLIKQLLFTVIFSDIG